MDFITYAFKSDIRLLRTVIQYKSLKKTFLTPIRILTPRCILPDQKASRELFGLGKSTAQGISGYIYIISKGGRKIITRGIQLHCEVQ